MTNKKLKLSASTTVQKKQKPIHILYTSVKYAVSKSGTVPPVNWADVIVPTSKDYPYLWTRTVVMYSDGSSTTSYSVSAMGSQGPAGTSVRILGTLSSVADLAAIKNPSVGDGYIINGMLWSYSGKPTNNYGFFEIGKVQGPAGKDAITIVVTPSTVIFDADTDGTFATTRSNNDGLGEDKSFQILVYEGENEVSNNCKYSILECENFTEYQKVDNMYFVTIQNGYGAVYNGGVQLKTYTFSDGKTVIRPCSEALIKIGVSYNDVTYIVQVNISVQVSAMLCKIYHDNEQLTSEYTAIKNDYASKSLLQQTANDINATVEKQSKRIGELETSTEEHTSEISNLKIQAGGISTSVEANKKQINGLSGKITENSTNISKLDAKADLITTEVRNQSDRIEGVGNTTKKHTEQISTLQQTSDGITSTIKKSVFGDNILRGQNGVGWSNNIEFDSAGPSYKFPKSSEWYIPPAFKDFGGDCILSFHKWGDSDVLINIYVFDQTYNDSIDYDVTIDKKAYDPNMKILGTSYKYTIADLKTYGTAGYVGTWEVNSVDGVSVGDKVAIQVFDTNARSVKHIYASVTEINNEAKTVKAESIDLLYPAYAVVINASTGVIFNNTEIGKMHYDKELDRYWIRFKEASDTNKTFLIKFRPEADGETYISRVMVEDGVDEPHKYMDGFAEAQSMIKQTANEIIQQVGDTYVRIGDGNITLNGDTKVNGSLTLNSEDQGFILNGDNGKTEISPKSIGTSSDFKSKVSHTIRTNISFYRTYGVPAIDKNKYFFDWTTQQVLGTIPGGSYLVFKNFKQSVFSTNGDELTVPSTTFEIYENDTLKKSVFITKASQESIVEYTVSEESTVKVVARSKMYKYIYSNSNQGKIAQNGKLDTIVPIIKFPSLFLSISWDNILPITNGYMLIGYDGLAINFGNNKSVYIGKDEFTANYGGHEIRITSDGIFKRNGRNVHVVSGAGTRDSPVPYTVEEPVDTVLCISNCANVIFPKNPYEGQVLKIFDKCSDNCYINSNGKYVVWYDEYGTGKTYGHKGIELENRITWQFTYMNGRWYTERIM